jgi:hypothetical protein
VQGSGRRRYAYILDPPDALTTPALHRPILAPNPGLRTLRFSLTGATVASVGDGMRQAQCSGGPNAKLSSSRYDIYGGDSVPQSLKEEQLGDGNETPSGRYRRECRASGGKAR